MSNFLNPFWCTTEMKLYLLFIHSLQFLDCQFSLCLPAIDIMLSPHGQLSSSFSHNSPHWSINTNKLMLCSMEWNCAVEGDWGLAIEKSQTNLQCNTAAKGRAMLGYSQREIALQSKKKPIIFLCTAWLWLHLEYYIQSRAERYR